MKKKIVLASVLVSAIFWGCQNNQDYFDPTSQTVSEEMKQLIVPTGFDWSTNSAVNITVNVDNQYPGKNYVVEVFDNNPMFAPDAILLAKGLAQSTQPFVGNITYPKGLPTLYVRQTNPRGKEIVKQFAAQTTPLVVNFGKTTTTKASKSAVSKATTLPTIVKSYTTPKDAIVIDNDNKESSFEMNPSKGKHYVIKDNYKGTITFSGWGEGVELYLEGMWINTGSSINMSKGDKLIVQHDGKIQNLNNTTINMTNSALIFFDKDVEFNEENAKGSITINATNETQQVVNLGKVKLGTISQLPILYNEGTLSLGKLYCNTNTSIVANYGKLTIDDADLTNGIIDNNCQLVISNTLKSNGATINLASGTSMRAKDLDCGGTTFNLEASAILRVIGKATFNSNTSKIIGVAKEYALVSFKEVESTGWDAIHYSGSVEVEASKITANEKYFSYYTLESESGAKMVKEGQSDEKIGESECNDGGNETEDDGGGSESNYPQTVNLGNIYSYVFEDTYPSIGDYDMNDCVIDASVSYQLSGNNKISQLIIKSTLRAAGSTKNLALGIQLDGIAASIVSGVTRTGVNLGSSGFASLSKGIETGQKYAVIPITDNIHRALGLKQAEIVNTIPGGLKVPVQDIVTTVQFSSPIDISNINLTNILNVFIISGGSSPNNRLEVHLRNYKATDKAKDYSAGGNYTASGNLVYAISIPESFNYPKEYNSIPKAYIQFKSWATSGGSSNPTWHKNPVKGGVYTQ